MSYIDIYVPIVMYGLRLVLQELHCSTDCLPKLFVWSELDVVISSPSFVTPHRLVFEIAKCIAWGCLLFIFTTTNLFTTVFAVIIVVCSLKKYVCAKFRLLVVV